MKVKGRERGVMKGEEREGGGGGRGKTTGNGRTHMINEQGMEVDLHLMVL